MLQFMDCSNCGKRVRTTAVLCHHCRQLLVSSIGPNPASPNQIAQSPGKIGHSDHEVASESSQAHYALSGGYDPDDDDFDYDEFLANEFPDQSTANRPTVKPWIWITTWVLIAATLLPFLFYFLVG